MIVFSHGVHQNMIFHFQFRKWFPFPGNVCVRHTQAVNLHTRGGILEWGGQFFRIEHRQPCHRNTLATFLKQRFRQFLHSKYWTISPLQNIGNFFRREHGIKKRSIQGFGFQNCWTVHHKKIKADIRLISANKVDVFSFSSKQPSLGLCRFCYKGKAVELSSRQLQLVSSRLHFQSSSTISF